MIKTIFSDFYYIKNIKNDISIEKLKKEIYDYKNRHDIIGDKKSNLGGYQSKNIEYSIVREEYNELSQLFDLIEVECQNILQNNNIFLSNAWINVNKSFDYNRMHCHPASILSGSIYIDIPKDSDGGEFVFHRSRDFLDYNSNIFYANLDKVYSSVNKKIEPKIGDMIIFPSYLMHEVLPHSSDSDRISIAFNTTSNM